MLKSQPSTLLCRFCSYTLQTVVPSAFILSLVVSVAINNFKSPNQICLNTLKTRNVLFFLTVCCLLYCSLMPWLQKKKRKKRMSSCVDSFWFWFLQWKEAKPEELMDSKLRCVFELPLENEKTVSAWYSSTSLFNSSVLLFFFCCHSNISKKCE